MSKNWKGRIDRSIKERLKDAGFLPVNEDSMYAMPIGDGFECVVSVTQTSRHYSDVRTDLDCRIGVVWLELAALVEWLNSYAPIPAEFEYDCETYKCKYEDWKTSVAVVSLQELKKQSGLENLGPVPGSIQILMGQFALFNQGALGPDSDESALKSEVDRVVSDAILYGLPFAKQFKDIATVRLFLEMPAEERKASCRASLNMIVGLYILTGEYELAANLVDDTYNALSKDNATAAVYFEVFRERVKREINRRSEARPPS